MPDLTASPGRAPGPGPMPNNLQQQQQGGMHQQHQQQQLQNQQQQQLLQNQHQRGGGGGVAVQMQQHQLGAGGSIGGGSSLGGLKDPIMVQNDVRKVSGISSEIFRQIEMIETERDPSTAAAMEVSETC